MVKYDNLEEARRQISYADPYEVDIEFIKHCFNCTSLYYNLIPYYEKLREENKKLKKQIKKLKEKK